MKEELELKKLIIIKKRISNLNQWRGEKFDGILYVHGEQGVGDQILYSSMIADLYKIHNNICIMIDSRMVNLFKRSFKKIKFISEEKNIKYNIKDKHILFGSLGKFFRNSLDDFKQDQKSWLIPDEKRVAEFKKYFSQSKKVKVGLSWKTSGIYNNKRNVSLVDLSKNFSRREF